MKSIAWKWNLNICMDMLIVHEIDVKMWYFEET